MGCCASLLEDGEYYTNQHLNNTKLQPISIQPLSATVVHQLSISDQRNTNNHIPNRTNQLYNDMNHQSQQHNNNHDMHIDGHRPHRMLSHDLSSFIQSHVSFNHSHYNNDNECSQSYDIESIMMKQSEQMKYIKQMQLPNAPVRAVTQ